MSQRVLQLLVFYLFTAMLHAAPAGEIRALWADSWGEGFLSPTQTDALLRDAWDGGYNTVIVEVRKVGDAYYSSNLEPRATNLAKDYDPLADLSEKATHPPQGKPALNVQAWIVVNRIWIGPKYPPKSQPAHIVNAHPEWLMKNEEGQLFSASKENHLYQDPANPDVVEHIAALVHELVGKYAIDALHLDYIRYPGREWGYSDTALRRYAETTRSRVRPNSADGSWMNWRREQNDLLVRRIAAEARMARPEVALSASVVTWGTTHGGQFKETDTYAQALQNWPRWCTEGWMDELYLMNYKREDRPGQEKDYRDWITLGKRLIDGGMLVSGQAAYLNTPAGSLSQLRAARQLGAGLATYSYRSLSSDKTPRAQVLAQFARVMGEGATDRPGAPKPRTLLCGRVRDAEGRPVDAAMVVVEADGKAHRTPTDGTGFYAFMDLGPGAASVHAEEAGRTGAGAVAQLVRGKSTRLDLKLP